MTIETAKLDNGLTIICNNMPHLQTVAINAMVKVGSKDEDENNSGISHLIEHMAFKGTEKRNTQTIAEEFDNIGGYNNAYTSRENTSFHCKVIKDDWKKAMDIIGSRKACLKSVWRQIRAQSESSRSWDPDRLLENSQ